MIRQWEDRRKPLEPIFNYEPRRGAIDVGNTPGTLPLLGTYGISTLALYAACPSFDDARDLLWLGQRTAALTSNVVSVDISDPSAMTPVGSVATTEAWAGLRYDPNRQVVWALRTAVDALVSVNATNPAAPAVTGNSLAWSGMGSQRCCVYDSGNTVMWGWQPTLPDTPPRCLYIADVTNLAAKVTDGSYDRATTNSNYTEKIDENHILVVNGGDNWMSLFDVSNRASPSIVWTESTDAPLMASGGTDQYVYHCKRGQGPTEYRDLVIRDVIDGSVVAEVPTTFYGRDFGTIVDGDFVLLWNDYEIAIATLAPTPIAPTLSALTPLDGGSSVGMTLVDLSANRRQIALGMATLQEVHLYGF